MVPDIRAQDGPHVFVDDLELLGLGADDHHHLARSLRLRAGDSLTASDARGAWRSVSFGDHLTATGDIHHVGAPAYELSLGIALTKASKPEFAVQKATELGMDHVVVFQATHSVARWDETKRSKNEQRLQKVAREAAMQSRRVTIPTVSIARDMVSALSAAKPGLVARADFGGIPTVAGYRMLLIGPEGGWSAAERDQVPETVDLGSTVLRAETAAVTAAAFLSQMRDRSSSSET